MTRQLPSPTIDVDELRAMLEERQPVTVLDIRKAEDRAEWAIPGSLHIDAYEALKAGDPDALADVRPFRMDAPVVTVCGAGKVSLTAMEQLRAAATTRARSTGGMKAWSLAWNSAEVPVPGSAATVVQVRRTGKGCLSYLIGNGDEAVVIDAALPPAVYQDLAAEHGWTITHVLDTHVHADHLSRSRAAGRGDRRDAAPARSRIACPIPSPPSATATRSRSARPGLTAMRTPGHTLESTSYLLDGRALFTGDTLFLAGVGRPDLEASAEQARARARLLHASLRRLAALPRETLHPPRPHQRAGAVR